MKHLRTRVLFEILIPTLTVFLLITIGSYLFYINNYRDSVIEKKQMEFLNVSRLFSDWISGRMRELILIAASDALSGEDLLQTQEYLISELSHPTYEFSGFWLINRNGRYWKTGGNTGFLPAAEDSDLLFRGDKLFLYLVPKNYQILASEPFLLFGELIKRASTSIVFPGVIISARSRQLRSSRIFPGQS